ncbi:hypothetical protein GCM10007036_10450 [Alsobacter metallidurans]|uniref:Uncharacterized protein n=1 Tax=Alsobacter metallidurans TaxID=340221 RepID=A0A917I432_9HYPH|nr:hypothetical protein [Alsobacter metallidurans]GGH12539.1 hypothetical protein GCM10007036_10450 [Alsobacter metallidurans]
MRMIEGCLRRLEAPQPKRFGCRIEQMTDEELAAETERAYGQFFPMLQAVEQENGAAWKEAARAWWLEGLAKAGKPDITRTPTCSTASWRITRRGVKPRKATDARI